MAQTFETVADVREAMANRLNEALPQDICALVIRRNGLYYVYSDIGMTDPAKSAKAQALIFDAAAKITRQIYHVE